jgi:hypothetical protein
MRLASQLYWDVSERGVLFGSIEWRDFLKVAVSSSFRHRRFLGVSYVHRSKDDPADAFLSRR